VAVVAIKDRHRNCVAEAVQRECSGELSLLPSVAATH